MIISIESLIVILMWTNELMSHDIPATHYHASYGINAARRIWEAENHLDDEMSMRIVHGSRVPSGKIPFQAGVLITLINKMQSICGASLISANHLISAAHCWWDGSHKAEYYEIVLGTTYLYKGGTRILTNRVTVHEFWNPKTVTNDIAIIKILPVQFSENIYPINLPVGLDHHSLENVQAVASGFGTSYDNQKVGRSQSENFARLVVISNFICARFFGRVVTQKQICTDGAHGQGVCHGDSGGPLFINNNGRPVLIGISSFVAKFGCERFAPSAYTRVTSFLPWVVRHLLT